MPLQVHKEKLTGSTASGALTLTSVFFKSHMLHTVRIVPTTDTNTYNLTIQDVDDDVIYAENGIVGNHPIQFTQPVKGAIRFIFASATVDEPIDVICYLQEE